MDDIYNDNNHSSQIEECFTAEERRELVESTLIDLERSGRFQTTGKAALRINFEKCAFDEVCCISDILATIMPKVAIRRLMYLLAKDPEAFRIVLGEILDMRAKLINLALVEMFDARAEHIKLTGLNWSIISYTRH
jgi:hypothetical protein